MSSVFKPEYAKAAAAKIEAVNKVKHLSVGSDWTVLQEIMQDLIASSIIKKQKPIGLIKMKEMLKTEVIQRYSAKAEENIASDLIAAIPSIGSLSRWQKLKGWEEAVWVKVRGEGMFTLDRRAKVIDALFEQATEKGNVNAAKVFLTLSGDYVEKGEQNKKEDQMEQFREIHKAINSKK